MGILTWSERGDKLGKSKMTSFLMKPFFFI